MQRSTRNRLAVAVVAALTAVLWSWVSLRESATEKEIRTELVKLRASGEPTTATELVRLFPNPPSAEDAHLVFGPVFNMVTNSRSRPPNPVSFANWKFSRTQSLDPA